MKMSTDLGPTLTTPLIAVVVSLVVMMERKLDHHTRAIEADLIRDLTEDQDPLPGTVDLRLGRETLRKTREGLRN